MDMCRGPQPLAPWAPDVPEYELTEKKGEDGRRKYLLCKGAGIFYYMG